MYRHCNAYRTPDLNNYGWRLLIKHGWIFNNNKSFPAFWRYQGYGEALTEASAINKLHQELLKTTGIGRISINTQTREILGANSNISKAEEFVNIKLRIM